MLFAAAHGRKWHEADFWAASGSYPLLSHSGHGGSTASSASVEAAGIRDCAMRDERRGDDVSAPRHHSSSHATARIGLPVPPLIFSGNPMKRKRPLPTSCSIFISPSMWVKPRSRQT